MTAWPPPSPRERRVVALATLAVAALAALVFSDYGITWDESVDHFRRRAGELTWSFWFGGFHRADALFDYGHNPSTSFAYYSIWRGLSAVGLKVPLPELWHLLTAWVGVGALPLAYWLTRRLGGPRWALVAAALLALSPRFAGHAFGNFKDVPFATAWLGATLTLVRALEQPTRARVLQHGLALGGLLAVRIGGLLFAPVSLLGLGLALLRAAPGTRGALVRNGLAAGLLALALHTLSYPYVLLRPVDGLLELVQANQRFAWFGTTLSLGLDHSSAATPWWYVPVWLGVTLPEITLVGLVLLLATAGTREGLLAAWRDPARAPALRLTLVATAWPLGYLMVTRAPVYDGCRHFLFAVPLLAVLAAQGLQAGVALATSRLARRAWAVALTAAAVLLAVDLVRYHPYQMVWFNTLTAGAAGAQGRFTLDYWGSSSRESSRWLAQNRAPGKICLIGGIEESWQYYLPRPWQVVTANSLAECASDTRYAYSYSRNDQLAESCRYAEASKRWEPIHSVTCAGATLGTWYQRAR